MKLIRLTRNEETMVDNEYYDILNSYKWHCNHDKDRPEAVARTSWIDGRKITTYLHHIIMGKPLKGFVVDHIDGNIFNNQRSNLRIITHRQNLQNRHKPKTSKYIGVSFHKGNKLWQAKIDINKKRIFLGYFDKEEVAFFAYLAALEKNGEKLVSTPTREVAIT